MPQFGDYPTVAAPRPTNTVLVLNAGKVNQAKIVVNSIADLRAIQVVAASTVVAPLAGAKVSVLGFATPGDGGGGDFYYDPATAIADNGGTYIVPTAGSGNWIRIFVGDTDVKWFGAKGDGTTNDTSAIQAAISSISSAQGGYVVFFPAGKYVITSTLVIGARRITLRGSGPQGSNATQLTKTGVFAGVDFINAASNIIDTFSMEYLQLQGDGTIGAGNGLTLGTNSTFVADCRIDNCWFNQIPNACINMVNVGGYHITNNGFEQSAYGIFIPTTVISSKGNNIISNNRFFGLTNGIYVGFSGHDTIVGNHFDSCGDNTDTTAAIVLNPNGGTEIRGTSIIGNNFRANFNDILCLGASSRAGHTGVTANSIQSNISDFAQRHFLYSNTSDGLSIIGNTINDPGQQTDNTFGAIDLHGATNAAYVTGNWVNYGGATRPAWGLILSATSTATQIGVNYFNAVQGTISFGGGTYSILPNDPGQIPGTATNDSAAAGKVGEYIATTVAFGSAVSLVNATAKTVASIALTPGDWDVEVTLVYNAAATTTVTQLYNSISLTTNTANNIQTGDMATTSQIFAAGFTPNGYIAQIIGPHRMSLAVNTTAYAVAQASFGTSTVVCFGTIRARRVR